MLSCLIVVFYQQWPVFVIRLSVLPLRIKTNHQITSSKYFIQKKEMIFIVKKILLKYS